MSNFLEQRPAFNTDTRGVENVVWEDDGLLWHAIYDDNGQKWVEAQTIPGTDTNGKYNIQLLSSPQLFPISSNLRSPGLVVIWQEDVDNNSELYYSVARYTNTGELEWSEAIAITSDATADQNFSAYIENGTGKDPSSLIIASQKIDSDDPDEDTDLYYIQSKIEQENLVFQSATANVAEVNLPGLEAQTPYVTEETTSITEDSELGGFNQQEFKWGFEPGFNVEIRLSPKTNQEASQANNQSNFANYFGQLTGLNFKLLPETWPSITLAAFAEGEENQKKIEETFGASVGLIFSETERTKLPGGAQIKIERGLESTVGFSDATTWKIENKTYQKDENTLEFTLLIDFFREYTIKVPFIAQGSIKGDIGLLYFIGLTEEFNQTSSSNLSSGLGSGLEIEDQNGNTTVDENTNIGDIDVTFGSENTGIDAPYVGILKVDEAELGNSRNISSLGFYIVGDLDVKGSLLGGLYTKAEGDVEFFFGPDFEEDVTEIGLAFDISVTAAEFITVEYKTKKVWELGQGANSSQILDNALNSSNTEVTVGYNPTIGNTNIYTLNEGTYITQTNNTTDSNLSVEEGNSESNLVNDGPPVIVSPDQSIDNTVAWSQSWEIEDTNNPGVPTSKIYAMKSADSPIVWNTPVLIPNQENVNIDPVVGFYGDTDNIQTLVVWINQDTSEITPDSTLTELNSAMTSSQIYYSTTTGESIVAYNDAAPIVDDFPTGRAISGLTLAETSDGNLIASWIQNLSSDQLIPDINNNNRIYYSIFDTEEETWSSPVYISRTLSWREGNLADNLEGLTVYTGDFDADGFDDLLTQDPSSTSNPISIYYSNQANGSFTIDTLTLSGLLPASEANLYVGDFDGDGFDDFLQQQTTGDLIIQVYLSSTEQLNSVTTDEADSLILVADYNGDGFDDFLIQPQSSQSTNLSVYLGSESGDFTQQQVSFNEAQPSSTTTLRTGDFNDDGKADLLSQQNANISIYLATLSENNLVFELDEQITVETDDGNEDPADLEFTKTNQSLGNSDSFDVVLADFDGDGDLDAFVANYGPNRVWFNDGDGNFTEIGQPLGSNKYSDSAESGDIDGDGDLDVFVTGGYQEDNEIWLNDGLGNFTKSGQSIGGGAYSSQLGDIDGDGDLDIYIGNRGPDKVWFNDGDGNFTDSGQSLGNNDSITFSASLGDIDGDRDLDVLSTDFLGRVIVRLNNGSGNFNRTNQILEIGENLFDIELGYLNNDEYLDLVAVNTQGTQGSSFTPDSQVWLNDGEGTFVNTNQEIGSSDTVGVDASLGDIDLDGDTDILLTALESDQVIWLNDGDGNFSNGDQSLFSSNTETVRGKLGDLNGDGSLDVFLANEALDEDVNNLNNANLVWLNSLSIPPVSKVQTSVIGDFNGDGFDDFLTAFDPGDDSGNVWQIYFSNDTSDEFEQLATTILASETLTIVGDFNQDEVDDVITEDGQTIYLSNGDGTFTAQSFTSSDDSANLITGNFDGKSEDILIQGSEQSIVYLTDLEGANPATGADIQIGQIDEQTAIFTEVWQETSYLYNIIQDEPALYYRLNESEGTEATNQGVLGEDGFTGIYEGEFEFGQSGALAPGDQNTAIKFNNGSFTVSNTGEALPNQDFSIEFWVKFTEDDSTVTLNRDWQVTITPEEISFDLGGDNQNLTEELNLPLNQWHYVVAGYSTEYTYTETDEENNVSETLTVPSKMAVYVNGQNLASTEGVTRSSNGEDLTITAANEIVVDEVALYNYALQKVEDVSNPQTSDQISEHFSSQLRPINSGTYQIYQGIVEDIDSNSWNNTIIKPQLELVPTELSINRGVSDYDLVSESSLEPNGETDLHFLLTLDSSVVGEEINSIQLQGLDGNQEIATWEIIPENSDRLLGVVQNSTELLNSRNPDVTSFSHVVVGTQERFDLYADATGINKDNIDKYNVTVSFVNNSDKSYSVNVLSGNSSNSRGDADFVSPDNIASNNIIDLHFQANISAPGETIKNVKLSTTTTENIIWETSTDNRVLDVQVNDVSQNDKDNDFSVNYTLPGSAYSLTIDLYADPDDLALTGEETYQVEFTLENGETITQNVVPIGNSYIATATVLEDETTSLAEIDSGVILTTDELSAGNSVVSGELGNGERYVSLGVPGYNEENGGVFVLTGTISAKNLTAGSSPSNGIWISGLDNAGVGYSLATGNIDGDGIDDLVIGAPKSGKGAIYVIYGKAINAGNNVDLSNLSSSPSETGFKVEGENDSEEFGFDVAVGNIDGDGLDEIVVGAPASQDSSGNTIGRVYVVNGDKETPSPQQIFAGSTTKAIANNRVEPNPTTVDVGSSAGFSVAISDGDSDNQVDFNGDGFGDILIGAPGYYQAYTYTRPTEDVVSGVGDTFSSISDTINENQPSNTLYLNTGRSYIIYGSTDIGNYTPDTLNSDSGFTLAANPDNRYSNTVSGFDVSFIDINGDKLDDAAIGAPGANNNRGAVYTIFGDSSKKSESVNITSESDLTINGDSNQRGQTGKAIASAGDVDNDNIEDLIIASPFAGYSAGQSNVVFGDTNLTGEVDLTSSAQNNALVLTGGIPQNFSGKAVSGVGDVNGDSVDDFVVSAPQAKETYIVFGHPWLEEDGSLKLNTLQADNGYFIESNSTDAYSITNVADLGDINGDGFADLLRIDSLDESESQQYAVVDLGESSDELIKAEAVGFDTLPQTNQSSIKATAGNIVGDFDGDGFDDFLVQDDTNLKVIFGGDSELSESSSSTITNPNSNNSYSELVEFVFFANYEDDHKIYFNDGNGNFTLTQSISNNYNSYDVALADLDGDGDMDAFVANGDGKGNQVFRNENGKFVNTKQSLGSGNSRGVDLADLDNDGDIDAFVANDNGGDNSGSKNTVWLNDGDGGFSQGLFDDNQRKKSRDVSLGDVDNDGDIDAFIANNDQSNRLWINDGSANFSNPWNSNDSRNSRAVELVDLNGDNYLDVIVGNDEGEPDESWLNNKDKTFTLQDWGLSDDDEEDNEKDTKAIAVDDFNGDGNIDFIAGIANSNVNRSWTGDGTGKFPEDKNDGKDYNTYGLAFGDIEGDGDLDLFAANNGDNNVIYINNGGEVFRNSVKTLSNSAYSTSVAVATYNGNVGDELTLGDISPLGDFNGDGLEDFAVIANTYRNNYVYVVYGNSNGTIPDDFNDLTEDQGLIITTTGGTLTNVTKAGDVNGDGFDDLAFGWGNSYGINRASVIVLGEEKRENINLGKLNLSHINNNFNSQGIVAFDSSNSETKTIKSVVEGIGDINGDGFDDLSLYGDNASFITLLTQSFWDNPTFKSSSQFDYLPSTYSLIYNESASTSELGSSVSNGGDINGDGFDDFIIAAPYATNLDGNILNTGVIYVVFGNSSFQDEANSNNNIDIDDLVSDNLAFKITGLDSSYSGISVNGGEDIDGDGFDDVIISTKDDNGKDPTFVIFGGDFTASVNQYGTFDGNDVMIGTPTGENMIGASGNDIIKGNGGADYLQSSRGDDVLIVADTYFTKVDGGDGNDTLVFAGYTDQDFALEDLIASGKIEGIEAIDLSDYGSNTLTLPETIWLLKLSDTSNTITITGDSEDIVAFPKNVTLESTIINDVLYNVYRDGNLEILLDTNLEITAATTTSSLVTNSFNALEATTTDISLTNVTDSEEEEVETTEFAIQPTYLSIPRSIVSESEGEIEFVITRTGDLSEPLVVKYHTVDSTGKAGIHYHHVGGFTVFEAEEAQKTVTVDLIDNEINTGKSVDIGLSVEHFGSRTDLAQEIEVKAVSETDSQIRSWDILPLPLIELENKSITSLVSFDYKLTTPLDKNPVIVTLEVPESAKVNSYFKFDFDSQTWSNFEYDGETGAEFIDSDGNGLTDQVRVHLVDGQDSDNDGLVNGIISALATFANINNVPDDISITNLFVTENAPDNTLIGRLSTIDPDVGDSHTYTLLDDAQGRFKIVGDELQVADTSQLDFESDPDLDILVESTDSGGLSVEKTFTVNLIDDRDFDVTGTQGDDLINSGIGGEVITGLGGKDTFIYEKINEFGDIITDFNANNDDLIDLKPLYNSYTSFGYDFDTILGENPFEDLVNVTAIGSNDSRISVSPYGQLLPDYQLPLVTLEGVTPAQIDKNDFIFS